MTSTTAPKVQSSPASEQGGFRVIGGRATPSEIDLIDQAARELGQKRGTFVVRASVALARRVLSESKAA